MADDDVIELRPIIVTPADPVGTGTSASDVPPLPRNRPPLQQAPVRRQVSKELAELEVNGSLYSNWTTVQVVQKWTEAFPTFQFECTEEVPIPLAIKGAHFAPGDVVRVFLGGHNAVFGYITERHVGFDANNHGVKLVGCGDTVDLVNSSVPLDVLNGHDGESVYVLAQRISQHLGVTIHRKGAVDDAPFKNIGIQPGETPMQVIERYAKMRDIVIGSMAEGGLLLIGEHPATTVGALWEGVHILRANVVVRDENIYRRIFVVAQGEGSDQANGDPQNKIVVDVDGTSTRNRVAVVVADVADTRHGAMQRAQMESLFAEGSYIEAQITVQGWFKDNNQSENIWRAGEYYTVESPSLLLNNEVLGCAGCIYEQSDAGTTTTLHLVRPIHMNGKLNYRAEALEFAQRYAAQRAAAQAAADALKKQQQESGG